ncbi:hypothetical protein GCM10011351_07680 [Paraliobacillus quinghaiensis]|uniref:Transcription initiation factor TFIIIB n=1 Tax=Paraliobacillus quinghaiensis TaxID=470815 RepID=A0A917TIR8_9BACI|nr:hypothetical protein [Paraliobacillus quinghaiensis]GGM24378.1 hypothetical protein GCM10011351_07680 [Paraliobacillus quinghaiensis]
MSEEKICPSCGNDSFVEGKLDGYAAIRPVDRIFSGGSAMILRFCNSCGEVDSIKVEKPQKFK